MNFTDNLAVQLEAAGFTVTEKQLEQFTTYYEMLIETNKSLNLTAITDPHEIAVKHFVDSLTALDEGQIVFKTGATLLDLGTGAGFPGIPLAIMRPDLKITLLIRCKNDLLFRVSY